MAENAKKEESPEYNGFPFITPFQSWVKQELEYRKSNNKITGTRQMDASTPFVRVYPGFSKDGTEDSKPYFGGLLTFDKENGVYGDTFENIYSTDKNFRPRAGIVSLNVSYKNKIGSVRKAVLEWECHTLEDLEYLSQFFMMPGFTVFLEWGWNLYEVGNDIRGPMQLGKKYPEPTEVNIHSIYKSSLNWIENSRGLYDCMTGIITNYAFSMNKNGGFVITTEIMSSGILMEGILSKDNITTSGNPSSNKNQDEKSDLSKTSFQNFRSFLQNTYSEYITKAHNVEFSEDTYRFAGKFFKINESTKAEVAFTSYEGSTSVIDIKTNINHIFLSWGFIEDMLLSKFTILSNSSVQDKLIKFDSRKMKIKSHIALRSTNLNVGFVNYDILQSSGYESVRRYVYINAKFFKDVFENTDFLIEAVLKIFNAFSEAHANFWNFTISETPDGLSNVIIDQNSMMSDIKTIQELKKNTYEFSLKHINLKNDPIKSYNFNSKLSNAAALNVFYDAHKYKGSYNSTGFPANSGYFSLYKPKSNENINWKDTYTNGPYYYEADQYKTTKEITEEFQKDADGLKKQNIEYNYMYRFLPVRLTTVKKTTSKEDGTLTEFKESLKSYNFKCKFKVMDTKTNNDVITTQFSDDIELKVQGLSGMQLALNSNVGESFKSLFTTSVVPLDFELELPGISGIRIGDCFRIDYIPSIYKNNGVFFVIGLEHIVEKTYWSTKIKAGFRVLSDEEDTTTYIYGDDINENVNSSNVETKGLINQNTKEKQRIVEILSSVMNNDLKSIKDSEYYLAQSSYVSEDFKSAYLSDQAFSHIFTTQNLNVNAMTKFIYSYLNEFATYVKEKNYSMYQKLLITSGIRNPAHQYAKVNQTTASGHVSGVCIDITYIDGKLEDVVNVYNMILRYLSEKKGSISNVDQLIIENRTKNGNVFFWVHWGYRNSKIDTQRPDSDRNKFIALKREGGSIQLNLDNIKKLDISKDPALDLFKNG